MRGRKHHEVRRKDRRSRIVLVVERLLPLPHHAQKPVIDHGYVNGQTFLHDCRELRRRHLETTIARNHPDIFLRAGKLRTDRSRQGETHRAKTA